MIDTIDLTLKNLKNFFNKIEETKTCWIWKAYKDKDGYGKLTVYSKERKGPYQLSAHRISYELFVGSIPQGLQIDHLCRNTSCVNPNHLELVTINENLLRSPITLATINTNKTSCPKGHPYSHKNINGHKVCKICHEVALRKYYQRKKQGDLKS